MFLLRPPSPRLIDRFLREAVDLPLSYAPVGLVRDQSTRTDFDVDEVDVIIGRG